MRANQDDAPATYALIIGIDYYAPKDPPAPAPAPRSGELDERGVVYKCLRGCVNDALAIERAVRGRVPDVKATRLIAPLTDSTDLVHAGTPPTYENIVAAWLAIIERANPGDLVFIHYSGHGGKPKTWFPTHKPDAYDESIVPCDINDRARGRYLRDVEIALLLERMAAKGLITTLVLDSCHAGGATRDHAEARAPAAPDFAPRAADALGSAIASPAALDAAAARLATATRDQTWHLDSSGKLRSSVTVLAACRPHEFAYEYTIDAHQQRGVLSYYLEQVLEQRVPQMTYGRLYDQVFANVHAVRSNQSPLLFGERDRLVLGQDIVPGIPTIPVQRIDRERIQLGAGASVCVEVGQRFAIVPANEEPQLANLDELPQIEVIEVHAATAIAVRRDNPECAIGIGDRAVLRGSPITRRHTVRIHPDAKHGPALIQLLSGGEGLVVASTDDVCDLQICCDDRIYGRDGNPLDVPPAQDAYHLYLQLEHIARFHAVQRLRSAILGGELEGRLVLSLLDAQRQPLAIDCAPFLGESKFYARIYNQSHYPLEVTLIDLAPDWSISTLCVRYLHAQQHEDVELEAFLPEGLTSGRDTLKAIALISEGTPLDASLLETRDIRQVRSLERSAHHRRGAELTSLIDDLHRGNRNARITSRGSSGWTTAQVDFETRLD